MRTKLLAFLECINGIIITAAITAIPAIMVNPDDSRHYFIRALFILIPYLVSHFASKYMKHFVSYLVVSAAVCGIAFLYGNILFEKAYMLILSVILVFMRIPPRLKREKSILEIPAVGTPIFLAIISVAVGFLKNSYLSEIEFRMTFLCTVNFLIYINVNNLNAFLNSRRNTSNLPGNQITATNRALMLIFSAAAVILMLLFSFIPGDRLLEAIKNGLINFFRFIFSLFPQGEESVIETTAAAVQSGSGSLDMIPTSPTPQWLTALYNVLYVIMSAAVLVLIAAVIIFAIYQLIRHFYKPADLNSDASEFIDDENTKDFTGFSRRKKKERSLTFDFHPDAVIRKKYVKTIKKGIADNPDTSKVPIPGYLTPSELENYAALSGDDNALLHELYEKARYSEDGCTKDDVSLIKRLKTR